jgi:hypothetical protein
VRNFIILIILISLSTGCITKKGTRLDTSNLIQLPNGTWKLRPLPKVDSSQKIEPIKATLPPSKPVKFPPARVKPTPTTASSVAAEISPVKIEPAGGDLEPFTPTVSTTPQKLPPFPIVDTSPVTGVTVSNEAEIAGPCEMAPPPPVEINWSKLITFYLLGFAALGLLYFGYMQFKKDRFTAPIGKPPTKKIRKRRTKKKASKPKSS